MRLACIVTGLALAIIAGCHRAPAPGPAAGSSSPHFALVLERTATGDWAAHCEVGCAWTDVSMSCGGCQVQLDASGIGPAGPPARTRKPFAFVVRATSAGWEAEGISGVRWRRLSWGCRGSPCRARIDEGGVAGV
jgi:hypothetical protein